MLKPLKRAGGRRRYRPADIALLEHIQDLLDRQGYTIRGARAFLAQKTAVPAEAVAEVAPIAAPMAEPPIPGDLFAAQDDAALIGQLQAIRTKLAQALAAA